jgi:1-aminocyclopropane-1-carboxylate deaminase/D-cysteine desulfhydrase-like pyridoxal-dependent ACC family enzyme
MFFGNGEQNLVLSQTPIEEHLVGRRKVYVKRDDLCCLPPAPPLGKLRGLELVMQRLVAAGQKTIACWDTRFSKLGVGLAAVARQFDGVQAIVCYPQLKNGEVPETIRQSARLGAEIVPMRGNHVSICLAQATRLVNLRHGIMLPFGLDCVESVNAIAAEAHFIPAALLRRATVVLSCGSGVTLAGLLRGLVRMPRQLVGVSSGRSVSKLQQCIRKYVDPIPANVTLVPANMRYDYTPRQHCPFPAHPNYDLKAWKYLVDNSKSLQSPLLFWNIGA